MSKLIYTVLLLIMLLIFGTGMKTEVPAALKPHETDEPLLPTSPPLKRHDVYDLKLRLRELGFYAGPLDEIYDAETVKSVKSFQKNYFLEPTGVVNRVTWKALAAGIEKPYHSVPKQLPEGEVRLEINTENAELTVWVNDTAWKTYPVAVGKWSTLTPVGEWKIIDKGFESGGAFGTRWMSLDIPWGGYGIHGTNRPWSIGSYASQGCIRMFNEEIEELFEIVSIGTRVKIIGYRPLLDFTKPLTPGTIGPEVVRLQEAVRELGFDAGPSDGRYGQKTQLSVQEIRDVFGLGRQGCATVDVFVLLHIKER